MKDKKKIDMGNENIDQSSPFDIHFASMKETLIKAGVSERSLDKVALLVQSTVAMNVPGLTFRSFTHNFATTYVCLIGNMLTVLNKQDEEIAKETLRYLFETYKKLCEEYDLLDENGNLKEV